MDILNDALTRRHSSASLDSEGESSSDEFTTDTASIAPGNPRVSTDVSTTSTASLLANWKRLSGRRYAICDTQPQTLIDLRLIDITLTSKRSNDSDRNKFDRNSYSRRRRRERVRPTALRRQSTDLGVFYPGDLLSLVQPRPVVSNSQSAGVTSHRVAVTSQDEIDGLLFTRSWPPTAPSRSTGSSGAGIGFAGRVFKYTGSLQKQKEKSLRRSPKTLNLADILLCVQPSYFHDKFLETCKNATTWSDVIPVPPPVSDVTVNNPAPAPDDGERKRRDAVWELLSTECRFLLDHLLPLKHCFLEPLKQVQGQGQLTFVDPTELFGNIDQVCETSASFCYDFLTILTNDTTETRNFGRTESIIRGLQKYCELTRDGAVYDDYCLSYLRAQNYIKELRKHEDFKQFEAWCESDVRCRRLLLCDLLVAPIQHYVRVPLVLNNIIKHTHGAIEKQQLGAVLNRLETSLKNLETRMSSAVVSERMRQIQRQLSWPTVLQMDPRAYVPDELKHELSCQPCESTLFTQHRKLIHEGPATLIEISKKIDLYLFLFDDLLLLTRVKRPLKQKLSSGLEVDESWFQRLTSVSTECATFYVHRRPLAVENITVHDVTPVKDSLSSQNGCLLRNSFVVVEKTKFDQIVGVYTLQFNSYVSKTTWLKNIELARSATLATPTSTTATPCECGRNGNTTHVTSLSTATTATPSPRDVTENSQHHRQLRTDRLRHYDDLVASDVDDVTTNIGDVSEKCRAQSFSHVEPPPRRAHYARRHKTLSNSININANNSSPLDDQTIVDSIRL